MKGTIPKLEYPDWSTFLIIFNIIKTKQTLQQWALEKNTVIGHKKGSQILDNFD